MAKSLRYRLIHRIRRLLGVGRGDDFDWAVYDHKYQNELQELDREYALALREGDYEFKDGELRSTGRLEKPLHPNARLLYETVLQLEPKSLCEFGCGGGDHLHNFSVLGDAIELHGLDRARGQLAILRKRHPHLSAHTRLHNIADPLPAELPQVDVAYTQAVLMHIHTGDIYEKGLANIFKSARRAVVLMENWTRHAFLDDIRALKAAGGIPWDELHVHYRNSPEYDRPHILVASAVPLPGLPVLDDYAVLLDPLLAEQPPA